jgi:shikimate dehydrogenase
VDIFTSKLNVVLTGMPGSGKTTVGKLLAAMLGRAFIDTDKLIEEKYGAISNIFETDGEKRFRELETEAVKKVSKNCGCVIATGGGAILRAENVEALKSNGRIFFIDRPLEALIPTEDRPLARDVEAIKKRYEERCGIYNETADVVIKVNGTPECVSKKIIEEMV